MAIAPREPHSSPKRADCREIGACLSLATRQ
jgi:hypothetical protein